MKNESFKKTTLDFEKITISRLKQTIINDVLNVFPKNPEKGYSCSCTCEFFDQAIC